MTDQNNENNPPASPGEVITVRQAGMQDAAAYRALRLEALASAPTAFSADLDTNTALPPSHWTGRLAALGSESMIYSAVREDELVGMCGIARNNSPKTRHAATIWGVYVREACRGQGVGEALVNACLGWAREQQIRLVRLGVVTVNAAAIRCYLRCGFQVYGVEQLSILYEGRAYDELLMARTP